MDADTQRYGTTTESGDRRYDMWEASYNIQKYIEAKFDNFCYKPKYPYFSTKAKQLLDENELERRGCKKRVPDVIIGGVKKCGTGALLRFLTLHPDVTGPAQGEVHYFDHSVTERNVTWYKEQMPYTTQRKLVVEKTPQYFTFGNNVPERIRGELPRVKIIFVLCDPVRRAVSDYLEYQWQKTTAGKQPRQSFESEVIGVAGKIRDLQEIVDVGIYVKYLIPWYDIFGKNEIFLLDGTKLLTEPFSELHKVENFLNLRKYFRKEHFTFNQKRRVYCVNFPGNYCLPISKGRTHPHIEDDVWQKLCDFYLPYNRMLRNYYQQNFTWDLKCSEQKI
ncbi:heparan sulfate glucosamine 3-O-sulfotransferase 1-like [Glandiceps talaboti]